MPGRLIFSTTTDGASTPTERLRITSDGKVRVPDNGKFVAGAGDDLQIYHNGSHSYIADEGTGELNISGSRIQLLNAARSEKAIDFVQDGAVDIYHNGSKKFETTANGIEVSGTVTDSIGDVRRLGIQGASSSFTLAADHAGKLVRMNTCTDYNSSSKHIHCWGYDFNFQCFYWRHHHCIRHRYYFA